MKTFWKISKYDTKDLLQYLEEDAVPQDIGEGNYAKVYWLRSNRKRILKITVDRSDALACMAVLKHPQKNLLKVFDVFKINQSAYGIIAEKCTPLSHSDIMLMDTITQIEEQSPYPLAEYNEGLTVDWVNWLQEYISDEGYKIDTKVLDQYRNWAEDLEQLDIVFWDLHSGNVMNRGHRSVIVDLGYSDAPPSDIPTLESLLET